jgi:hypothetical protein
LKLGSFQCHYLTHERRVAGMVVSEITEILRTETKIEGSLKD